MKFMALFIIWQFFIYLFLMVIIKYAFNYKIKDEAGKKKIDSLINTVGWVIGIAVPVVLWLSFASLAMI